MKAFFTHTATAFIAICAGMLGTPLQSQPAGARYSWENTYLTDTVSIPLERYRQRRDHVKSTMSNKSISVFFSADVRNRQNDVDYEYRQDNWLWYLSGIPEPEVTLVLIPGGWSCEAGTVDEIAFVKPRSPQREAWTGVQLGPEGVLRHYGISHALPANALDSVLSLIMNDRDTIFITQYPTAYLQDPLFKTRVYAERKVKDLVEQRYPKATVRSQKQLLSGMRQKKDSYEIALLQKAVDITIEGHLAAMKAARPGISEYQLEAEMEYTFKKLAAEDVGYPSIVGTGPNGCVLHYITNRRTSPLQADELVLMDCGAEYRGYTADITRTFPIDGTFTPEQLALYRLVLKAQDSAIAACRPGVSWRAPHSAAMRVIAEGLIELGIIGTTSEAGAYFNHGTSHFLGLDVHDVWAENTLSENMVITVEPGIYIPEGSPCDKKWWDIGIRIEDDILITEDGHRNMSGRLPRSPEEIEAIIKMSSGKK